MSQAPDSSPVVLIADDDLDVLTLLRNLLRSHNVQVIEASDGDEAATLAKAHKPDLVVLDVMMPGQSGWEVCRYIREQDELQGTKVVMLTGIGERMNALTSPLQGADAYLDKPFDVGTLSRLIDTLLKE